MADFFVCNDFFFTTCYNESHMIQIYRYEVLEMFTGKTKNIGVMGDPIIHSLSPVMQNAAIAAAGVDAVYIAMPVKPENLRLAVTGLRTMGFLGWNVTIPHKSAIMPLLDSIEHDARVIGAVNTVVCDHGRLTGYNTDVNGFLDGLSSSGICPEGQHVTLLGAGGAARAVLWGVIREGASKIDIGVRNPGKAGIVADYFSDYATIGVHEWESDEFKEILSDTDILINTTPLGMAPNDKDMPPIDWDALKQSAFVNDVIYTPSKTRFLAEAESHGHKILNGEAMLVGQGAASFRLWLDVDADRNVMMNALRKALGE